MPLAWGITTESGSGKRKTTLLYRPSDGELHSGTVVFFPGDVSDFAFSHRSDALFQGVAGVGDYRFSLEGICWEISSRIPAGFSIIVLRASFMIGCSSAFTNFVPSDMQGTPRWADIESSSVPLTPGLTLFRIIESLRSSLHLSGALGKITLIGFSKGCVVLSGIIRESFDDLLNSVHKIAFIDPGLRVPDATFRSNLGKFRGIPIEVWMSPYQYDDPKRPWLRNEVNAFVKKSGAYLHLIIKKGPISLESHFDTIFVALDDLF